MMQLANWGFLLALVGLACGTETGNPDLDGSPVSTNIEVQGAIETGVEESFSLASDVTSSATQNTGLHLAGTPSLMTEKTCTATGGVVTFSTPRSDSRAWRQRGYGGARFEVTRNVLGTDERAWRHDTNPNLECSSLTTLRGDQIEGLHLSTQVSNQVTTTFRKLAGRAPWSTRTLQSDIQGMRTWDFSSFALKEPSGSVSEVTTRTTSQVTRAHTDTRDGRVVVNASFSAAVDMTVVNERVVETKKLQKKTITSGSVTVSHSASGRTISLVYSESNPVVWLPDECTPTQGEVTGAISLNDEAASSFTISFGDGSEDGEATITYEDGTVEAFTPPSCAAG